MKPIVDILEERVINAVEKATGQSAPGIVKPTQDAKFGDYQANGVMGLAKKLKQNPRQLAETILEHLDVADLCEPPEIAGPGFINFRLKPDWLAQRLAEAIQDHKRLGVDPVENPPRTVVDFSSPNIAKQMHVGHLRSTIIGDVIARILEFWYDDENTSRDDANKKVIRQNHVGDWGLQMGMVIYAIKLSENIDKKTIKPVGKTKAALKREITLDELEKNYRDMQKRSEIDPTLNEKFREYTLKLQSGDPEITSLWNKAREVSLNACHEIYEQLGVKLGWDDVCGESFYNDKLPSVISELSVANMIQESEGAKCVFMEGFKTKEGEPLPMIVQKSDGAYLYATTDLAAIRYRVGDLKAERIIYVTDARQKLHFEMLFACVHQAGWVDENIKLEHVPFGSVLDKAGKPFKTRSGENVKLKDLLDEAITRARQVVEDKNPGLPDDKKAEIAHAVGIGAVKYADLSNNLVSDYVFDWDKMLGLEGNTAPYMQYAYARVQSIFRKGEINPVDLLAQDHALELTESEELALAKLLLRYGEIVETVARDLRPHLLTGYLYELAQAFSGFYTNCPVLKAQGNSRSTRLLLCYQTAQTIRHGLGLLGIQTIEQM